jgi:FtsZ-binding cell division protein ZapB
MSKTLREMLDELIMAVPFTNAETRYIPKIKVALDLINRLQAEKEGLINGQETLQKYITTLQAENERLNKEVDRLSQVVLYNNGVTEMKVEEAKAEAYKEVWGKLRSMCDAPHWCVWLSEIDEYFEKMLGEDNVD